MSGFLAQNLINKYMQTLRLFFYHQQLRLQLSRRRQLRLEDRQVYSRSLVAYQGLNNVIRVLVRNPDQKPQDISDLTLIADLVRTAGSTVLVQRELQPISAVQGIAQLELTSADLADLETGWYQLQVRYINSADAQLPAFVDDNYGISVPVQIRQDYAVQE